MKIVFRLPDLDPFFFAPQTDRRTQTHHSEFVSGSRSCSPARGSNLHDPEAACLDEDDFEQEWQSRSSRRRSRRRVFGEDAVLQNVEWDDDLSSEPSSQPFRYDFRRDILPHILPLESEDGNPDLLTPRPFDPNERTPLLVRPSSRASLGHTVAEDPQNLAVPYAAIQRKISSSSVMSTASNTVKHHHTGQSTFAQTVRIDISSAYPFHKLIWHSCSFSMPSAYSLVSVCYLNLSRLLALVGSGGPSLSLAMAS